MFHIKTDELHDAGTEMQILHTRRSFDVQVFLWNRITDAFVNDSLILLRYGSGEELKQLKQIYKLARKNPELGSVTEFITNSLEKLDSLKQQIMLNRCSVTYDIILEYVGTAMKIAMLPDSELRQPNLIRKLGEVANDLETVALQERKGICTKPLKKAAIIEFKVRNCLSGVIHRSERPAKYFDLLKENMDKTWDLYNDYIMDLTDEDREIMQQWLRINEFTLYDERDALLINYGRNYYEFCEDIRDDERTVKHGLKFLRCFANPQNDRKVYGIQAHNYLAFTCYCYNIAWTCIKLNRLPQAENCLAAAEAALQKGQINNFVTQPTALNDKSQHEFMNALVHLGYRHLLLSWANRYFDKIEVNYKVKEIDIALLSENPVFFKLPCKSISDVQQYLNESRNKDAIAIVHIPVIDMDYKVCDDLYDCVKERLKAEGRCVVQETQL